MAVLDHLVLATPRLEETVEDIAGRLGETPAPGGRHVGLGTRNHLLGLGRGAYLEIVGPDPEQPEPEFPRPFGIDSLDRASIVTWAVRTDDIEGAVSSARSVGRDPGDVRPMSRKTPGGDLLSWRLTLDEDGTHSGVVPFLIDWGSTPHPSRGLPVVPLESLEVTHPAPSEAEKSLRALGVGQTVTEGARPALVARLSTESGSVILT
ncbi:VOC family protein [Salininema proteolyticum]|uniref:VOC family protein n=1 Tax=Salininema proteolyticum TaxID=1607685 RepID=A0ABV8TUX3_9ACTN